MCCGTSQVLSSRQGLLLARRHQLHWTFSHVANMNSIQLIVSLDVRFRWDLHQMDLKSAFVHGDFSSEIYMEQLCGIEKDSSLVCRLKKSLYGLKKAPRAWYENIDHFSSILYLNVVNLSTMFMCCMIMVILWLSQCMLMI